MRTLTFLFFLIYTSSCFANDVDNAIQPLGLTKDDLKNTWYAGRCDKNWKVIINKKILTNKEMLVYKAISSNFFKKENFQNKKIKITADKKCIALNKYYFNGVKNDEIIEFINKDIKFINKYGYSVMDAIYIESTQFYSWDGKISEFNKMHSKELASRGLFTIEEKSNSFNDKHSVSISGKRTTLGDKLYDNVFK